MRGFIADPAHGWRTYWFAHQQLFSQRPRFYVVVAGLVLGHLMLLFSQNWRPIWMLSIRDLPAHERETWASIQTPWLDQHQSTTEDTASVRAGGGQTDPGQASSNSPRSARWVPSSERLRRQQLAQVQGEESQPEAKQALPGWVAAGCVLWAVNTASDQEPIHQALQDWPGSIEVRTMSHPVGYVVYVPAHALRHIQVGEFVKEHGLVDIMYLQSPPELRGAMSLGIFSSEESALAEMTGYEKRGLKHLKIAHRMGPARMTYVLRGSVADMSLLPTRMAFIQRGELRRC